MPNTGLAQLYGMNLGSQPTHEIRPDFFDVRVMPRYKTFFDKMLSFAVALEDDEPCEIFRGFTPQNFFLLQIVGYQQVQARQKNKILSFSNETDRKQIFDLLPGVRKIPHPKTGKIFYIIEGVETLEYQLNTHSLDEMINLRAGGAIPAFKVKECLEILVTLSLQYMNSKLAQMESTSDEATLSAFAEITSQTLSPIDAKLTPEQLSASNLKIMEILKKQHKINDS
jgi:hypothetical protein